MTLRSEPATAERSPRVLPSRVHANCFVEAGYERALLIDFNYDTEPWPGP